MAIERHGKTDDPVTVAAARAIAELGAGVTCATITVDAAWVRAFNLTRIYRRPNGTIHDILERTVFSEPIICRTCRVWCRIGSSRS